MQRATRFGAIVLCGGKSSRMGQPKHLLQVGPETALQRVVRTLFTTASDVVVVAAASTELPLLPDECEIVYDEEDFQGPLMGIMYGMRALQDRVDAAYVTGCDTPLLRSDVVKQTVSRLDNAAEIVVPVEDEFYHPLGAVYRLSLLPRIEKLIDQKERRPRMLFKQCRTTELPVEEYRSLDSQLDSFRNMNTPEDYAWISERAAELATRAE